MPFPYVFPFPFFLPVIAGRLRLFFVEAFSGDTSYSRPFATHSLADPLFAQNAWLEPVPFNLDTAYGVDMAQDGGYVWLTHASGVWRAPRAVSEVDLTLDTMAVKTKALARQGDAEVTAQNADGAYAAPGTGALAGLDAGGEISVSPGYITAAGAETSPGLSYQVAALEHISGGGKAMLVIHAEDGWARLAGWRARHQFRWNQTGNELAVQGILRHILARVGLKLTVVSESATVSGFYPDFILNPGVSGLAAVNRLLSFVPDQLFLEGNTAYMVNPLAADTAVYSYGTSHAVIEGRYGAAPAPVNRVEVVGFDAVTGLQTVVDSFDWDGIAAAGDRLEVISALDASLAEAGERGAARLRRAVLETLAGRLIAAVHPGQQMYDVVDVTDAGAGLTAALRRVCGISLVYDKVKGEYRQRLDLGGV
jgi:hypothetical protein